MVDLYAYFVKAINKNLNHMDGYEERMDNWYKNMDELLSGFKANE